ncbi:MAG TPA: type III-B CRISPR module-associated protein Cmr3 [Chloroflexi bacterium]|nr:type III-B CRISPR module-associated protein Cmr3 [Chloroflexota bacterium]
MTEKTVMRLFLEPVDVALFRAGRSFTAGSDHRARSLFPPNPSTVLGALRSKLLMDTGVSLAAFAEKQDEAQVAGDQIGWPDKAPPFALRGPFIAAVEKRDADGNVRRVKPYYPLPADVVKVGKTYHLLKPLALDADLPFDANWPKADPPLCPLWLSNKEKQNEAEGWVDEETLQALLSGDKDVLTASEVWSDERLFARESRFGVGIDSQRKCYKDGMLYQVEFIRPREGIGLAVDVVEGAPSFDQSGLLSMGGESRPFRYYRLETPGQQVQPPDKGFKVYFATPAYFKCGWLPEKWSTWFGGDVQLVAVALRRARTISGARVDTKSQQGGTLAKAGYKFVPAGSVYYFKAKGEATYSGKPVSEFDKNDANSKSGYGTVLFGKWDYLA